MKRIILLFILLPLLSRAQNFRFSDEIGHFNFTSSFCITANGLIYVTDTGEDEIYQLDTLGNLNKTFGGYGWTENSFDDPMDVFADPLSVYVADKNNHQIKRFDKNLNFVSSLYTRDSDDPQQSFGYPLSCATSNQGDLYLVDSENKRVLKFDFNGNFQQNFGGFDAGDFALKNPSQLAISSKNNIFVTDENKLVIFDQFGNGIGKINFQDTLSSVRITFNNILVTTQNKIYLSDLSFSEINFSELNLSGLDNTPDYVSAIIFNKNLYVLSENSILIFRKD